MRRWIVFTLASAVVVGACSGSAAPRRAAESVRRRAPHLASRPAARARRLVGSWSRTVAGAPGGIAGDRDGVITTVDDDTVVALDAEGSKTWSTPVLGAGLGWPSLGHGLVVVPTSRDEGGPGGCVALDRATGARRWAYEERDSQGVAVARAGDDVICALANGVVVAVDRETGARRWRHAVASGANYTVSIPERSALAVDDATGELAIGVTVNGYSALDVLDIATGSERGVFDFTKFGAVSSPVSTAPGVLAVGVSASRSVCTIDLRRLRIRSCVEVPSITEGFDPSSIPLVADGNLLIATHSSVVAVDLATMKVRWTAAVANPILSARPVAAAGVVVFCDWSRVAWALRLSDGSPVAIPKADGWVTAAVAGPEGFDVATRDLDGGWIEHWAPAA